MASPHPGNPQHGPAASSSYYPQGPVYGNLSPSAYHYPNLFPMQHQQQPPHQHSPRLGGRGGAGFASPNRGGHIVPNQNFHQPYSHPPAAMPGKRPQPYSPTYASAATMAWQSQQPLSPLPKQLSMPPPLHFELQPHPANSDILSTATSPPTNWSPPPPPAPPAPEALPSEAPPPRPSSPSSSASPPPAPKFLGGWAIWSRRPHDPSHAPGIIISPNARPPPDVVQLALELSTPPPSPPSLTKDLPTPVEASQDALDQDDTLLISQTSSRMQSQTPPQSSSTVPSSAVTETDTPTLPGSPFTSNTSALSTSVKGDETYKVPTSRSPSVSQARSQISSPAPAPSPAIPDADAMAQKPGTPPPVAAAPAPAPTQQPVKKSWASLLQPSSSASGPSSSTRNALPTSSVVGFSVPATSPTPAASVSQMKKRELLGLLSPAAGTPLPGTGAGTGTGAGALKIRPRGLINSGNMCFATSVLQMLVYTPPFHMLFVELGRVLETGKAGREEEKEKAGAADATPLVDATVEFLREFAARSEEGRNGNASLPNGAAWGRGKGKGKERDREGDDQGDEWDAESFLPGYVYDAMKGKKRFDNMGGGQQEDAEEFLGFYLDTLEEELLGIVDSLSATPGSNKPALGNKQAPVEEKHEMQEKEDGWLEVGRKNKMVVTRTIKGAESPITRIFGGKFRSTLRAPHQKDSVIVEDWRALRLDIQRDHIHSVQDALAHISHPQSVQVTHPSRPGIVLEASQQILIEALPNILVLHMKRFCYDTNVGGVVKVAKQVRFGPELEVGNDVMAPTKRARPTRYKLFGVLYHHGHSASGGHYTLDVLHPNRYPSSDPTVKPKETWVRIDDELVSDVRPEDVFGASEREEESRCAYLLFYRRIR